MLRDVYKRQDVLIAISNSGESDKVLEAVKIANKNGAMTLGITNSCLLYTS